MKVLKKSAIACICAAMAFAQVGVSGVRAQQAGGCSCVVQLPAGSQTVGSLVGARGDVLVSRASGFGAAASTEPLLIGSKVIVGANSSASMMLGQCRSSSDGGQVTSPIAIPADTTVTITAQGGSACVKIARATETFGGQDTQTQGQTTGAGLFGSNAALPIITGVVLIGGGIGLAVGLGGKKKRSN